MRQCGPCTACCTSLAVDELAKPTHSVCRHECAAGCAIYARRPQSCRDYRCLWLTGLLQDEDRPDRLGVIFNTTHLPRLGAIPMLVESIDGALRTPRMHDMIQRMAAQRPVLILTARGDRYLVGPQTQQGLDAIAQVQPPPSTPTVVVTINTYEYLAQRASRPRPTPPIPAPARPALNLAITVPPVSPRR